MTIGKPELCVTFASLNRFAATPRERHLELAIIVFGYHKTVKNKKIAIDSRPMMRDCSLPEFGKLRPGSLKDYPDVLAILPFHFILVPFFRELSLLTLIMHVTLLYVSL